MTIGATDATCNRAVAVYLAAGTMVQVRTPAMVPRTIPRSAAGSHRRRKARANASGSIGDFGVEVEAVGMRTVPGRAPVQTIPVGWPWAGVEGNPGTASATSIRSEPTGGKQSTRVP